MSEQDKFNYSKEIGEEYQRLVEDKLLTMGITLRCFSSRFYQLRYGENPLGLEIKHDSKWQETGRLYFETEAISKDQTKMIAGGIMKEDKSWLYLIGDEKKAWLFSKAQLQRTYKKLKEKPKNYETVGVLLVEHIDPDTKVITSRGMAIPTAYAESSHLAIKVITF